MWLVAEMNSSALFGLGLLLLICILLRRSARYHSRQARPTSANSDELVRTGQPRKETPLIDAPSEVLRWQVEMHDTARQLKAELDSKMSILQSLMRMAQQESQRLDAAIARATELGISTNLDVLAQIERLATQGLGEAEDSMLSRPSFDPMAAATLPGTAEQRSTIYSLADLGHSSETIARQVGSAVGDVELILSCRGQHE